MTKRREYVGPWVIERSTWRGHYWVYERGFTDDQCPEWFDAPRLFSSKSRAIEYACERA